MVRRITLAAAVVALLGCAASTWQWSSEAGRQCFYGCKARGHQCAAYCGNNWQCHAQCNAMVDSCLNGCPDLRLVEEQEPSSGGGGGGGGDGSGKPARRERTYNVDSDCAELCAAAGRCRAVSGKCVP